VIEPRKRENHFRWSGRWVNATDSIGMRIMASVCRHGGVRERGVLVQGFPRNLGDPDTSTKQNTGREDRLTKPPGPRAAHPCPLGTNKRCSYVVPAGEGNEAQRDECQEVGVRHRANEGGEPSAWDPLEGRAHQIMEP